MDEFVFVRVSSRDGGYEVSLSTGEAYLTGNARMMPRSLYEKWERHIKRGEEFNFLFKCMSNENWLSGRLDDLELKMAMESEADRIKSGLT